MKKQVLKPGSYSEATLRDEDLLNAFFSALESVDPAKYRETLAGCAETYTAEDGLIDDEFAGELVEELIDLLNAYTPEGCYFGAHEGDGADFGVWPIEDDEPEDDDDEPQEPEDGDYIIEDCGRLGSRCCATIKGQNYRVEADTREEVEAMIKVQMKNDKFYPNVWALSDHGNYELTTLD